MIIDGTNAIVGRLCAQVAKFALNGETVDIVNAEKAVISGNPLTTVSKYAGRREMTQKANPEQANKWPRRPDMLLKRIIRGMLPKHSGRGKDAQRRIKTHLGVPKEFEGKAVPFEFTSDALSGKFISLKELSERL
ncbi:MAG: 50S ribosomal protein L13 [Candidatus Micrarchaeota archaeon]